MKRTHLNFAIDCLAFAGFLALLSTGLLLQYRLPPGSGSMRGLGAGSGSSWRPITTLWDWSRHDWGQIHFWIAAVLLAVLAAHIVLHWKWIVCVVRGTKSEASGGRFALGVVSAIGLFALAATPLLYPTEATTRGELRANASVNDSVDPQLKVRGSMSIAEVAQYAGLTTKELLAKLGLPVDESPSERLGPLLRRHGKRVSDVNVVLNADGKSQSPKPLVR
jgi:hypothetical protein